MARPLRIELAGGLYHVTSRGDRREDIYIDDADREQWLLIFAEVCSRFNWVCHAWCQMTNHYHIVIETPEANLSQGMRHLNGVYTQWINRSHHRVGHVFQGRYKAILVEKESYLLELSRYVVLNPVRAGMVRDASGWPWSSYRTMTGQEPAPAWLQTDWLLAQFSVQRSRAIARYIAFVSAGLKQSGLWTALKGQIYLGNEQFVTSMQQHALDRADITEIPRAQRRAIAKSLTYYQTQYKTRNLAITQAFASGDYTMQQIAAYFKIHYSTVSRAIKASDA